MRRDNEKRRILIMSADARAPWKTVRRMLASVSAHAAANPFVAGALLLMSTASPAFAYIDPGTGSLLLQIVLAVVAAVSFKIRSIMSYVKSWLQKRK
jgi:hypothetical protein